MENVAQKPLSRLPYVKQISRGKVDATIRELGDRTIMIFVTGVRMHPFMELGTNCEG
jgi:hypothetical protein